METGPLKPSMPNDSSPRAKVLQLVESGRISASEAAELLKAMRFAAVPIPAESGFVLLPLDDVNFDELRQRTVRFAVEANGAGAEIALSFEEAQAVIFQLLREVYGGAQGTLVDLDGGNQRLLALLPGPVDGRVQFEPDYLNYGWLEEQIAWSW